MIPVLVEIHSSEVSTIFSKSAFVKIFLGKYEPVPQIEALISFFTRTRKQKEKTEYTAREVYTLTFILHLSS
ncbi:Uncharacterised protein [Chlamydia trachomatis]|nr:Uncharacterised protein [Chlamydia trachomatis]